MLQSTSARIVIRKDVTKKDGTKSLILRVIIDRKVYFKSLGISVRPERFSEKDQSIALEKGDARVGSDNAKLKEVISRAYQIFNNYFMREKIITIDEFKRAFENFDMKRDFLDFYEKKALEEKASVENCTYTAYIQTLDWLKEYFKKGLAFGDINAGTFDKFHKYLARKLGPGTLYKHKKNIQKFINIAIREDIPIVSPYGKGKVEVKRTAGEKESLNMQQLQSLIDLYLSHDLPGHLQNTLGMFLFSCVCGGIRFSDVRKFTEENIMDDMLIFVPQKNKRFQRVVKIPVPEYARQFIQLRHKNLFQPVTNDKANMYLKIIARAAEIKTRLTMHVARHTFATLFLESDAGDVHTLMEIMGISKYETVKVYIHIAQSRKKESMSKYSEFINSPGPLKIEYRRSAR